VKSQGLDYNDGMTTIRWKSANSGLWQPVFWEANLCAAQIDLPDHNFFVMRLGW
jgi:hypothetical protein